METVRFEMYTIDDIMALPEGQRAELVDGQMYQMALPTMSHQLMVMFLAFEIRQYIKKNKGKCQIIPSPFAVFLDRDIYTYLEPDVVVICDRDKLDEKGCHGAPDWVMEIVSPSSTHMDYLIKLLKYQRAGVREYWIIDLKKERVMVYNFVQNTVAEYTLFDKVPSSLFEDLEIDFSTWEGHEQ